MRSVNAYAMPKANAPFERTTIERRDPGAKDVVVRVAFCGICHSDIHTGRNEWGEADFPLVPGHEITGYVEQVGTDVTRFAPGDPVGVGVLVDSCRQCRYCKAGQEQYCASGAVGTYGAQDRDGSPTDGGYSSVIVVDDSFVVAIPDELPLDAAAPLLCAGVTTYSPLRHWRVGPGTRVAVLGMGGLGHLAVKFAAGLGADVTVLSQTLDKKADGLEFGAKTYLATSDPATFRNLDAAFDLVINTVSANLPMGRFLSLLDVDGVMVSVGLPPGELRVPAASLIDRRVSWAGSSIGSINEISEMLSFCADHDIAANIETVGVDEIDGAWDRVVASDVRYRFVIDMSTLR